MSKIIILDSDKFESIVSELEKTIPDFENVFSMQNRNYDSINGTDTWKGDTQRTVSEKYMQLSRNFDPITETLINYVKYLKITLTNYKNYENMVDKSVEQNSDNLNVN